MQKIFQGTFKPNDASIHHCVDAISLDGSWPSGAKTTIEVDKTGTEAWVLTITVEGEESKIGRALLERFAAKIKSEVANWHGVFEELTPGAKK